MAYTPVNWTNTPTTPLDADNLNHVESGVIANELAAKKANESAVCFSEALGKHTHTKNIYTAANWSLYNGITMTPHSDGGYVSFNGTANTSSQTFLLSLDKSIKLDSNKATFALAKIRLRAVGADVTVSFRDDAFFNSTNVIATNAQTITGTWITDKLTDGEWRTIWVVTGGDKTITKLGVQPLPTTSDYELQVSSVDCYYSADGAEVADIIARLAVAEENISSLQNSVKANADNITSLQTTTSANTANISDLQSTVNGSASTSGTVKNQIAAAKADVIDNSINPLAERMTAAESDITELKNDTDALFAEKADLEVSDNLVDFSVYDGQTSNGLTAVLTPEGLHITGTPTNDFSAFDPISLMNYPSGEYYVTGGEASNVYAQVTIRRSDGTYEFYVNTKVTFKDDDIARRVSIIGRSSTATYDVVINPSLVKIETIKGIEELLFNGIANVKFFGAIGDGVTDDTQSIINACKYALSAGKKVYIPSGKYACNLQFTNTKNLSIIGDGNWSSSLIPFDKTQPVIAFSADAFENRNLYIHLQNLTIGDEGGSVVGSTGLQLHTIQSSLLDNIRIVYFDKAIDCKGAMDFEWRNVNILHCGNNTSQIHAVSFNTDDYTSCNAIKAHGLRMEHCPLFFDAIALRHCFFTNCKFEQASKNTMDGVYAFQFSKCKENSFANCMFVSSNSTSELIDEYVAAEGEHFIKISNTVGQTNIKFIGCSFTTPDNASAHWIYGSCVNIINCDFSNCNGKSSGFAFHLFGKSSIVDTTIISKTGKKMFAYDGDFNDLDVRIVLPDDINNDTNKLLTATTKSIHGLFRYTILSGQSVTDDWFSNLGGVKIESRY